MLLPFTNPFNQKQYLAQAEIKRTFSLSGEKSLTGKIETSDEVIEHLEKRWTVVFQDETYVIYYVKQVDRGKKKYVEFDALHAFFDDFTKHVLYTSYEGKHARPLKWYLDQLFQGTGYHYLLSAQVDSIEKEDWGMKNKLSLFQDMMDASGLEYEINGKTVHIQSSVGSDLSTIVRKGFNLQDFNVECDFSKFVTYAEGFGAFYDSDHPEKGRLHVTYTSPLAKAYGILQGEPIVDERFTIEKNLLAQVKDTVDHSLAVSLNVTLEELQAFGYPYATAQPGDQMMVINESMGFAQKVRTIAVTETFDVNGVKIGTEVTFGSLSLTEKQQNDNAEHQGIIDRIIHGKDKIPPSWLTDFIVQNSEALNRARTQLKFTEQGIVAMDKQNHNHLVIFNSAGMGVSTNGGKTYENAITAQGINASAIVTGILKSIHIESVDITSSKIKADEFTANVNKMVPNPSGGNWVKKGEAEFKVNGDNLSFELRNQVGRRIGILLMDYGGYYILDADGHRVGGVSDEVVTSHAITVPPYDRHGWGLASFYIGTETSGGGELRVVDKRYLPNSGANPNNYSYSDVRARRFIQHSSERAKECVVALDDATEHRLSASDIIKETPLFEYAYRGEEAKQIGFIAEQSPRVILSQEGTAVDIYQTLAYLWRYAQEKEKEIDHLKRRLEVCEQYIKRKKESET